ncbi:hypothetical protein LMH87_004277 [Akanthomyces muscarius]|uniref:Uncharacterized protein n=1 Tax=Akanthomyces muscarius TaxID=2231603 RepID=A0A9W8UHR1_AKAMU|nr:hypothetical protein LMH87_004277 [Akanthomyces muscarius]KAJ4145425.1 hypothetical protein LMH87_004277 [Akanthomyces muscarius]
MNQALNTMLIALPVWHYPASLPGPERQPHAPRWWAAPPSPPQLLHRTSVETGRELVCIGGVHPRRPAIDYQKFHHYPNIVILETVPAAMNHLFSNPAWQPLPVPSPARLFFDLESEFVSLPTWGARNNQCHPPVDAARCC